MEPQNGVEQAITAAGSPKGLATLAGESEQVVSNWRSRGEVSARRAALIERVTGVSRRLLRPRDWQEYWPELADAQQTCAQGEAVRDAA